MYDVSEIRFEVYAQKYGYMETSLIIVAIMFLLFVNRATGFGMNGPQIRIRCGRNYPGYWELKYFESDELLSLLFL